MFAKVIISGQKSPLARKESNFPGKNTFYNLVSSWDFGTSGQGSDKAAHIHSLARALAAHTHKVQWKPVFGGLRTTKAQTSLRILAEWSAPLLFTYWKESYLNLPPAKFQFLASLCSWGDWFESHFVRNPEILSGQGPYDAAISHTFSHAIIGPRPDKTCLHGFPQNEAQTSLSRYDTFQ